MESIMTQEQRVEAWLTPGNISRPVTFSGVARVSFVEGVRGVWAHVSICELLQGEITLITEVFICKESLSATFKRFSYAEESIRWLRVASQLSPGLPLCAKLEMIQSPDLPAQDTEWLTLALIKIEFLHEDEDMDISP
ncbi:hypothetical protein PoB_002039400 [Plakobranchus ocellatus]|uniref:Uncharacterized protein n=1 Tax=Plakobranchus ocellatus TaxID=259542 RepID=A0AAV3ZHL0_9GAST|nr:hypothetical protein PoB_002039400 [Plakobranchus ocellatus]